MSSAASAAGYMSSAGLVSAIPALYLTTGRTLTWWEIGLWLFALSILGVFMAIPLKRQLINIDQLPFPSGIATAETLKSMHSEGGEAAVKARSLFAFGIVGAAVAVWRDLFTQVKFLAAYAFPAEIPFWPSAFCRDLLAKYTIGNEGSLIMVAARATGETDITPIGAMGKITQLIYGVVAPTNITTNRMTASITSGAASHAADLLTDLKSGYLLGGNPRKQTVSQLFGVLAGTLVSVPAYLFVVQRNPERLGSEALPAPSAKVWAGVAELLARGIDALFAGALVAWLFAKARPLAAETYTVPISSGLIAGESLMGVAIILTIELLKLW